MASVFNPITTDTPGYFAGPAPGHTAIAGTVYGTPQSGIVPDGTVGPVLYPGTTVPSFVFIDDAGNVRNPPTAGLVPVGAAITAAEAQALMTSTLNVAYMGRAQIRNPNNSFIQVSVSIVDLDGNVLAHARTPDAPIFGADVARQKARSRRRVHFGIRRELLIVTLRSGPGRGRQFPQQRVEFERAIDLA